jgi:hypothetical protein
VVVERVGDDRGGHLENELSQRGHAGCAVGDAEAADCGGQGFRMGTVFHEPEPQNATLPPVFADLVQECRRSEAHAVITVHGHMSEMAVCRMVLVAILDVRAGAAVHEISV